VPPSIRSDFLAACLPQNSSDIVAQIGGGFTNEEGMKQAVSSPELAPAGIILDAEVTLLTPERLWFVQYVRTESCPLTCSLEALHWNQSVGSCRWFVSQVFLPRCQRLMIRRLDIESLYRPLVPYPVKIMCYAAIADLFMYLPMSKANSQALDIRQKLQLASWMSMWPLKLEEYR
jgi:hypothetical protein